MARISKDLTDRATIKGRNGRVQVLVSDLTGDDMPESVREEKPSFYAYHLAGHYHPSTPFTSGAGSKIYGGKDPEEMMARVRTWLHELSVPTPQCLEKYLLEDEAGE